MYAIRSYYVLDDNLRNDSSTRAGNAAFCAADDGKFQEFHNQLFANQPATEGDGFSDVTCSAWPRPTWWSRGC